MDKVMYERMLKAVINLNGQKMEWHKPFLEYQDYFDLIVEEEGTTITLTTKFRDGSLD